MSSYQSYLATIPDDIRVLKTALAVAYGSTEAAAGAYYFGPSMTPDDPDWDAPRQVGENPHKALIVEAGSKTYHVIAVGSCNIAIFARIPGQNWFKADSFSDH
jgi:hypothetical protein